MKSDERIEAAIRPFGIEDFFFSFASFSEEEKKQFVSFFVPVNASRTHKLSNPLAFSSHFVVKDELKDFIKKCGSASGVVKDQILEYLVENEMCEVKEEAASGEKKEKLFTEKLLLIMIDLAEESGSEFVAVSSISERVAEAGDDRAKVGGSITSLEKGGFVERREDDENVRSVRMTEKGRKRIEKLLSH